MIPQQRQHTCTQVLRVIARHERTRSKGLQTCESVRQQGGIFASHTQSELYRRMTPPHSHVQLLSRSLTCSTRHLKGKEPLPCSRYGIAPPFAARPKHTVLRLSAVKDAAVRGARNCFGAFVHVWRNTCVSCLRCVEVCHRRWKAAQQQQPPYTCGPRLGKGVNSVWVNRV